MFTFIMAILLARLKDYPGLASGILILLVIAMYLDYNVIAYIYGILKEAAYGYGF